MGVARARLRTQLVGLPKPRSAVACRILQEGGRRDRHRPPRVRLLQHLRKPTPPLRSDGARLRNGSAPGTWRGQWWQLQKRLRMQGAGLKGPTVAVDQRENEAVRGRAGQEEARGGGGAHHGGGESNDAAPQHGDARSRNSAGRVQL